MVALSEERGAAASCHSFVLVQQRSAERRGTELDVGVAAILGTSGYELHYGRHDEV